MALEGEPVEKLPPGLDPDVRQRVVTQEALTINLEKMHHEATVGRFRFSADEPAELAGDDNHPRPLDYLLAAVGF